MAKKTTEERDAAINKAFDKLPGARDDASAAEKARFQSDKREAGSVVAEMIDSGRSVVFEPRDGFYCVRVEFNGETRRFTGPTARAAIEKAPRD